MGLIWPTSQDPFETNYDVAHVLRPAGNQLLTAELGRAFAIGATCIHFMTLRVGADALLRNNVVLIMCVMVGWMSRICVCRVQ